MMPWEGPERFEEEPPEPNHAADLFIAIGLGLSFVLLAIAVAWMVIPG